MDADYTRLIAIGTYLLAKELTGLEKDFERQLKKHNVVDRKLKMLRETFPTLERELLGNVAYLLAAQWSRDDALTFLIDLAFLNPFAPYELAFKPSDFEAALTRVGRMVGVRDEDVAHMLHTRDEALKAHSHINWQKIALYGLGGLAIVGTGGWLAAPIIGAAIGTAAGLSGAAATSYGLAILGGGSLAIGGAGMAGGMWLVTGVGAALGLSLGGGIPALLQLGAASARAELIKLQVNYREVLLGNQLQLTKAQEVIRSLDQQKQDIQQRLEEERRLNDQNAVRVKELEATLTALEDALQWMQKEVA